MGFQEYKRLFSSENAALKVLRARNAPMILSFLQERFKSNDYAPTLSNESLINSLVDFLEIENIVEEEADLSSLFISNEERASRYVKDWVKDGYLTLFVDDNGEDNHSLTPEIESVLEWVKTLLEKRSFIGTESRFLDIFHKLRELVQNSNDDWREKKKELEFKKIELERQIQNLELTQKIEVFEDYQVKDRFYQLNIVAKSLLRDFREVERNFQEITRDIYKKQTEGDQNKGSLLGFSLDALDELRETDQGKSFESFYSHLNNPSQKAELDFLIRQVFELLKDRNINAEDVFLKKIKYFLHTEGQKVNDSFYQLVKKLEKIISEKNMKERRKSLLLINDIKNATLKIADNPPKGEVFLEIDDRADYISTDIFLSLDEKETKITARSLKNAEMEDLEIEIAQSNVDKSVLLANIQYMLKTESQISLKEIVDNFGIKSGLSELMAYGSIAAASSKHIINDTRKEEIMLSETRKVEFPEIIFCK
jgi:hypothetical protein